MGAAVDIRQARDEDYNEVWNVSAFDDEGVLIGPQDLTGWQIEGAIRNSPGGDVTIALPWNGTDRTVTGCALVTPAVAGDFAVVVRQAIAEAQPQAQDELRWSYSVVGTAPDGFKYVIASGEYILDPEHVA